MPPPTLAFGAIRLAFAPSLSTASSPIATATTICDRLFERFTHLSTEPEATVQAETEIFDFEAMKSRLRIALEASGDSMREVSLNSGCGPGYLHSILSGEKEPRVRSLAAVCRTLNVSLSYILVGVEMSAETERLLVVAQANPEKVGFILGLLGAPTNSDLPDDIQRLLEAVKKNRDKIPSLLALLE